MGTVYDFYEQQFEEVTRFTHNPLEFIRSKEIIKRYLRKPCLTIADIAGATGPYSYWLAEQGHTVHLLDLSDKHLEQAKAYGKKNGLELSSFTRSDARHLPYEDNMFDITLNMGPLYHLQDSGDRLQCIAECYRVLKVGGTAIFAYISRFASLIDGYRYNFVDDAEFQKIIKTDLLTGKHENPKNIPNYFTTSFFHTPNLIIEELGQCNFQDIKVLPVEGFASCIDATDIMKNSSKRELLLEHLRLTEDAAELLGISSHILAVCGK